MNLTHIDKQNNPAMVDVGEKAPSERTARAVATVALPPEVQAAFRDRDIQSPKGPVFHTAIIAGTMAAKKTSDLIPFCHPIGLDGCTIEIDMGEGGLVRIEATCKVEHKTGVEMEALTAATVAALTVYDMCKALSHDIEIRDVRLLEKTGGKKDVRKS